MSVPTRQSHPHCENLPVMNVDERPGIISNRSLTTIDTRIDQQTMAPTPLSGTINVVKAKSLHSPIKSEDIIALAAKIRTLWNDVNEFDSLLQKRLTAMREKESCQENNPSPISCRVGSSEQGKDSEAVTRKQKPNICKYTSSIMRGAGDVESTGASLFKGRVMESLNDYIMYTICVPKHKKLNSDKFLNDLEKKLRHYVAMSNQTAQCISVKLDTVIQNCRGGIALSHLNSEALVREGDASKVLCYKLENELRNFTSDIMVELRDFLKQNQLLCQLETEKRSKLKGMTLEDKTDAGLKLEKLQKENRRLRQELEACKCYTKREINGQRETDDTREKNRAARELQAEDAGADGERFASRSGPPQQGSQRPALHQDVRGSGATRPGYVGVVRRAQAGGADGGAMGGGCGDVGERSWTATEGADDGDGEAGWMFSATSVMSLLSAVGSCVLRFAGFGNPPSNPPCQTAPSM